MKLLLTCSNFKYSADYPLRIIKTVILFFQCTVDFNILLTQCPLLINLQKLMSSSNARNSLLTSVKGFCRFEEILPN